MSRGRSFPSRSQQQIALKLRNNICRLSSQAAMARVASHLRGYAVGELIALIGTLDSHPDILKEPVISKSRALHQSVLGKHSNPLAHAVPCGLLINNHDMTKLFRSKQGNQFVRRIFGMGVMAPSDWETIDEFDGEPRQVNIVHNITEGFQLGHGLVGALADTIQQAAQTGVWDASGNRQHNQSSLTDFVHEHYRNLWRPSATQAYATAFRHLSQRLGEAEESNAGDHRIEILKARIQILQADRAMFLKDSPDLTEATRAAIAATEKEQWD